jgi:ABC-type nitrate/sulfonate/bicarbonate transport system substrate-binding protein
MGFRGWIVCVSICLILGLLSIARSGAEEIVHMAYGGHNETVGPTWVGIDNGFYRKYGLDVRLIQVRSAQISMAGRFTLNAAQRFFERR